MPNTELEFHLPIGTKKIMIEIMDLAEKHHTASFYVIPTYADFSILIPPEEIRYEQPATPIDELESCGLIENTSNQIYVLTQLAYRWREHEKKGPVGKFAIKLFIALRNFFSTVWGIVVGIGIILGIILVVLQILGYR